MAIRVVRGDIFARPVDAQVCPVNCEGIPRTGLAKAFQERYPTPMEDYKDHCRLGLLRPGGIFCVGGVHLEEQETILVCLATRNTWRDPSFDTWIKQGARALQGLILTWGLKSISIPALGCGLGGPSWEDVQGFLIRALNTPEIRTLGTEVYLYEPHEKD